MDEQRRARVVWLESGTTNVRLVGGKAASLARLAARGFRIPPGFCLTTEAFAAQLAAIDPDGRHVADLPHEEAREWLARAMETTPLPDADRRALDEALRRLAADPRLGRTEPMLAVRSSGIGEDGAQASYAGLHATELGVRPAGVEAAIRRCWASLWSGPAVAYRARKGLPPDGGGMAVAVQALVPAERSAVAFSRHPVTGTNDVLVTAVHGLGDGMVDGSVTPDTIVIDRKTRDIVDLVPAVPAGEPVLTTTRLRELVDVVLAIEDAFGFPVDVEAAASGDGWFLLQARPITARGGIR